jgi:hypothetical protein
MKRWISFVSAIVAVAVMPVAAIASESQSGSQESTAHYGPFASGSSDSATCGGDWADDTYKRVFEASTTRNANGTYSATEFFIAGHFVTRLHSSPGACNIPGTNTGGIIRAGVTGSFHGDFGIVITGGTFNPNAVCNQTTCDTTAKWVHTVYGAASTYTTGPSFEFTYHAHGEGLLQRMWHNASPDRGGNFGDIRSS